MKLDIKLEGPGDWIDTGDTINYKLIPGVDGESTDVSQITAAKLDFVIHEGMAGEGKLVLGHTDDDPLDELFDFENIVAGTWFRVDLTTNLGKVIATIE